jgi:hypothetical protein
MNANERSDDRSSSFQGLETSIKGYGSETKRNALVHNQEYRVRTEEDSSELNRSEPPRRLSEPQPLLSYPIVGGVDPTWPLTDTAIDKWAELFPTVDVLGECRAALAWIEAHPTKRKTARGMAGFLVRWLTRATDETRAHASGVNGGRARKEPATWACPHDPPCPPGTDAHKCHLRTVLGRELD